MKTFWTAVLCRRHFCKFTLRLLYVSFKNPDTHWVVTRGGVDVGKTRKIFASGESRNV